MSTIQEIEAAIRDLSSDDLEAFRRWFAEYDADRWDRQIEDDAAAGRLDSLAAEAVNERRRSATEILAACPGGVLFKSVEEVDAYIRAERDSWER